MIALLRYAFLKSARENFLAAIFAGPVIMLVAPVLGIAVMLTVSGRGAYPLRLPGLSATSTSAGMTWAALMLATISAATGGFWIFRREVVTRDIGVFVLAKPPRMIALAATTYGASVAISAYLISVAFTGIMTGGLPPVIGTQVGLAILSCVATSALGAALVTLSTDTTMMIPLYAMTIWLTVLLVESDILLESRMVFLLTTLVTTALLVEASAFLLRRRCAT